MFVFWQVKWLLEPSYDMLRQCDNVKSSGFVNLMTMGIALELKSRSKRLTVFVAARDHNTVDSLVMCGPVLLTFHDICHHKCTALKLCFFLSFMTWRLSPPRNQAKGEPVVFNLDNGCRTLTNTMWPVVQFYFSNMSSPSAVSVAIWILGSASPPQVGFLWSRASSTWEER